MLGTFATFVVLFGLGMDQNWTIVAIGVALLVLAVSIVAVTTLRGGARAWVTGMGHVHSVSEIPASSKFGRCEMQIVIDAPGLPPRSVKVRDPRVPVDKWPRPGAVLPIMVAIDDQRHVRILWDDVLTHTEAEAHRFGRSPEYADPLIDETLIEQQAPPWAQRRPDDDLPPEDDFPLPEGDFLPPEDDLLGPPKATGSDRNGDLDGLADEPTVGRHPPGGGIVLEGTLVDPPAVVPHPRRSRPSPRPRQSRPTSAPAGATADQEAPEEVAGTAPVTGPTANRQDAGGRDTNGGDTDDGQLPIVPTTSDEPAYPDTPDEAGAATEESGAGGIHGVGITVLVADLARSIAFYRDHLGFQQVDGSDGGAVLASGGTRLVLRAVPDIAPVNRRLVHINLEVDNVHSVYETLKSNGVRFTYAPRAVNRGAKLEQWAAAFRDPDGHGITLTQWRSREATGPGQPS